MMIDKWQRTGYSKASVTFRSGWFDNCNPRTTLIVSAQFRKRRIERLKKLITQTILVGAICLIVLPTAMAKKHPAQAASIAGVYENFTVGKGSGDLEGMRVVLVNAGNSYHAIVQIAQGGAEDPKPEFVDVSVQGMNISFTASAGAYTGHVTAAGLTIKDSSGGSQLLKRKPCSSFLR
jgi:hypothetical protein